MNDILLNASIGVLAAVAAVILMQAWPTRYSWAKQISLTQGEESGQPIYQVRLGRKRWRRSQATAEARGFDSDRRPRRRGPIDITVHARLAVRGLGPRRYSELVLPIPVEKGWRPAVQGGVLTTLLPQYCAPHELRYFPDHIRAMRAEGTLQLEDLLSLERSELRLYAYGYRPYTGTRLMIRRFYGPSAIAPGVYERGKFVPAPDGKPRESALDNKATAATRSIGIGGWRLAVWRVRGDQRTRRR